MDFDLNLKLQNTNLLQKFKLLKFNFDPFCWKFGIKFPSNWVKPNFGVKTLLM